MAKPTSPAELSPLDQIRLAESEITRKTSAAREAAEHRLAESCTQATRIKKQAREEGTRTGKLQYKETVSRAEEETHTIVAHAQNQADTLQQKGRTHMEMAIEYAVNIVLGLDMDRMADES